MFIGAWLSACCGSSERDGLGLSILLGTTVASVDTALCCCELTMNCNATKQNTHYGLLMIILIVFSYCVHCFAVIVSVVLPGIAPPQ
jgi:hypothetical protein